MKDQPEETIWDRRRAAVKKIGWHYSYTNGPIRRRRAEHRIYLGNREFKDPTFDGVMRKAFAALFPRPGDGPCDLNELLVG